MATGTWGGKKWWRPEPIPPVTLAGYFQPAIPTGYQAGVEVVCQPNELQPQRSARFAVLTIPAGGINRWTAPNLRAYAAALIQAAEQLEAADAWLATEAQ